MALEYRGLCPLLQVFDMPASLAFYRDALGFEIVDAAPPQRADDDRYDWVWLRRDSAELMLNSAYETDATRPEVEDPVRVAAHDDTSLYIGCPDVDAAWHHLRERGIVAQPPRVAPYGMKQLYLKDPDGFTICFQWTADAAAAAASG